MTENQKIDLVVKFIANCIILAVFAIGALFGYIIANL